MIIKFIKFSIFFQLFLVFSTIQAQQVSFRKFSKSALESDIDSLTHSIVLAHQNPFSYASEEEFNMVVADAKSAIKDSMNLYEFAGLTAQLLGALKDSHTYLNYGSLRKKYRDESKHTMNFSIRKIGEKYVLESDAKHLLPPGSVLIAINGMAMDSLYQKINKYSIAEGNSTNANQRITEIIFAQSLGYVMPMTDSLRINFLDQNQERQTIFYPTIPSAIKKKKPKGNDKPYSLTIDSVGNEKLAILKIASFSEGGNGKFYRFLKKSFKTMRKHEVNYLAIDLRDNLGGQVVRTDMVMGFLKENSAYIPHNIIAKQSTLSKKMYRKKINSIMLFFVRLYPFKNESLKNFVHQIKMKKGEMDTLYYRIPNPYGKRKYIFEGKQTFVMIDGASGSASVLFTSAYKNEIPNGLVVGQPCLGPPSGTWGNPAAFRLPNSGLDVFISTIRTNVDDSFTLDPLPIQPDYLVGLTRNGLINGDDECMSFLRKLILDTAKGN